MKSKKLKWKRVGIRQQEAVSLNKKYDFLIDSRRGVILNIFNHKIKDKNNAYIDSISHPTVGAAKKDAESWR